MKKAEAMSDSKDDIPVAELVIEFPPPNQNQFWTIVIIVGSVLSSITIFVVVAAAIIATRSRADTVKAPHVRKITIAPEVATSFSFVSVLPADEHEQIRLGFEPSSPIENEINVEQFSTVMNKLKSSANAGPFIERRSLFDLDKTIDSANEWGMNIPDTLRNEYRSEFKIAGGQGSFRFDRLRLISARSISSADAIASAYVWNEKQASSFRFWFTKRNGDWKLYDWQDLNYGYRYSQYMALTFMMPRSGREYINTASSVATIGDGSNISVLDQDAWDRDTLIRLTGNRFPTEFQDQLNVFFAFAWLRLEEYQKCIDVCNSFRNPDSFPGIHQAQAVAHFETGQFAKAIQSCRKSQSIIGRSPETQKILANSFEALADDESALREFGIAFEIDPDQDINLRNYLQRGSLSTSRLAKLVESSDDQDSMILRLFEIFENDNSLTGLSALKSSLADWCPDSSAYFMVAGHFAAQSGDDLEALRCFEEALKFVKDGQAENVLCEIAKLKLQHGNAIEWLKSLDNPHAPFLHIRSIMCREEYSASEYFKFVEAYLNIFPEDVEARLWQAELFARSGQTDIARKNYGEIFDWAVLESQELERISDALVNFADEQHELVEVFVASEHKPELYSKFASKAFDSGNYNALEGINDAHFLLLKPASEKDITTKPELETSASDPKSIKDLEPFFYELAVKWNKNKNKEVFQKLHRMATDRRKENQRLATMSAELLLDDNLPIEMKDQLAASQMLQSSYVQLLEKLRRENQHDKLQVALGRFLNSVNRHRRIFYRVAIAQYRNDHQQVVRFLNGHELNRLYANQKTIPGVESTELDELCDIAVDSYFEVGKSELVFEIAKDVYEAHSDARMWAKALCRDNQVGILRELLAAEPVLLDWLKYQDFGDGTPVLWHPEFSEIRKVHPPHIGHHHATSTTLCRPSNDESVALRIEKFRKFKDANDGQPLQIAIEIKSADARESIWFDVREVIPCGFEQSELIIEATSDSKLNPAIKAGQPFVVNDGQLTEFRVNPGY
ncbi:hypothetical protein N9242_03210 [Vicingaceae bacterium]|nr:hypothetical protein [Vicingaceae bacterium]